MSKQTRDGDVLKMMILPATVLTAVAGGLLVLALSIGSAAAGLHEEKKTGAAVGLTSALAEGAGHEQDLSVSLAAMLKLDPELAHPLVYDALKNRASRQGSPHVPRLD